MGRCLVFLVALAWPSLTFAQDKLAFDVASIKPNKSGLPPYP